MNLNLRLPPALVVKYYLYRGAKASSFTAAIWYLYILQHSGTYASLGLIDALWWGGLLLFEVPTGYLGDRLGRRRGLIIGSVLVSIAQVFMGLASTYLHFVLIFVFWAFASTFRTGTESAWLYDALSEEIGEDQFARIQGRGGSVALVVSGVTAVAGGYIADLSMPYAYFASAGVTLLCVPIILSFPEANGDADNEEFTVLDALPTIREHFTKPPLRSFVLYVGLLTGVAWAVNVFIQPVGAELGLGPHTLGWLFGGFTVVGAIASYHSGTIKDKVGVSTYLRMAPFALGVAFGTVAFLPILAFPAFVLMRGMRGMTGALSNQFLNDHIDSLGRATLLSTAGMAYRMVIIPVELGSGILADVIGPFATIGLLGGFLLSGTVVLLWIESPFKFRQPASDAEGVEKNGPDDSPRGA